MASGSGPGRPTAGPDPRLAGAMVLGSIVSVQCGAALATTLFESLGPPGTVFLRSAFGALLLVALARGRLPSLRPPSRDIVLFGLVVAGVTFSFYEAIERLPLGIAVTLEFSGPLAVAVLGSRRRLDLLWALLAALGIVFLSGVGGGAGIDPLGAALALAAGGLWAAYIVLGSRLGAAHPGPGPVAAAAIVCALVLAPAGLIAAGSALLDPANLARGLGVGLLSSAVPFALEIEALRRLPRSVFGVLMSLEPAVAATVGLLALSQGLGPSEVAGIALVVVASAGALRGAATSLPPD